MSKSSKRLWQRGSKPWDSMPSIGVARQNGKQMQMSSHWKSKMRRIKHHRAKAAARARSIKNKLEKLRKNTGVDTPVLKIT